MSTGPNWNNVKIMAIQGAAPKITELYNQIMSHPLTDCVFLSTLYAKFRGEYVTKYPISTIQKHKNIRVREELILTSMLLHLEELKIHGLRAKLPSLVIWAENLICILFCKPFALVQSIQRDTIRLPVSILSMEQRFIIFQLRSSNPSHLKFLPHAG